MALGAAILVAPGILIAGFSNTSPTVTFTGADGNGVSYADINGDGCLDVLANDNTTGSYLWYQNTSGGTCSNTFPTTASVTFGTVTADTGTGSFATERSIVAGDYDNDGDVDFIRNTSVAIRVETNNGNGTFTGQSHGNWDTMNAEGVCWIDFDEDGDLDLVFDSHEFGIGILDNTGGGSFTLSAIHTASATAGDYIACADYNVDGFVDVYVRRAGSSGTMNDTDLWENKGQGANPAVTPTPTLNGYGFFGIPGVNFSTLESGKGGAGFCDLDGDGDFDLVRTESPNTTNRVMENTGSGWTDRTTAAMPSGFNTISADDLACADVDNDGDLDLVLSRNGTVAPNLYINNGSWSFTHQSGAFNQTGDGEGIAFGDYDRDGDMDLLARLGGNAYLFANGQNDSNYLQVQLTKTTSGNVRDAIGATVRLYDCDGNPVSGVREISGGRGHGAQDAPFAHFGLNFTGGGTAETYVVTAQFVGLDGGSNNKVVQKAVVPDDLSGYQSVTLDEGDSDDTTACNVTAATIGNVELASGSPGQYLALLNVESMSDGELLELLATWDADRAAALAGAERTALEAALADHLDPDGDGRLTILRWQTLAERGTIGFYAERQQSNTAGWQRINAGLLPGLIDAPLGGDYLLADPTARPDTPYRYRLIEQEAWGTQRTHGPYPLRIRTPGR